MKLVIYDCEIVNAIPGRGEERLPDIQYCNGWTDYRGMGVSVITAYVWNEGYRVFLEDNIDSFAELVQDPDTLLIGFNNRSFDDRLLEGALGLQVPEERSWDLMQAVQNAGAARVSLDTLSRANFLPGKKGSGAFAPILWQRGKVGQVIDYALMDTMLTKNLVELVLAGRLRDPESGRILEVKLPTAILREPS